MLPPPLKQLFNKYSRFLINKILLSGLPAFFISHSMSEVSALSLLASPVSSKPTPAFLAKKITFPPLPPALIALYNALCNHGNDHTFGVWTLLSAQNARRRYDRYTEVGQTRVVDFAFQKTGEGSLRVACYDPETKHGFYRTQKPPVEMWWHSRQLNANIEGLVPDSPLDIEEWMAEAAASARRPEEEEAWLSKLEELGKHIDSTDELPSEDAALGVWIDEQMLIARPAAISRMKNRDHAPPQSWSECMYKSWWQHVQRHSKAYLPSPSSTWHSVLDDLECFISENRRLPAAKANAFDPDSDVPSEVEVELRLGRWLHIQIRQSNDFGSEKSVAWSKHVDRHISLYS
jgi:hypothetical protein